MWFLLSILCAISLSTSDAISKAILRNVDEYLVAFIRYAFSFPFLAIFLFFIKIPHLDKVFWEVILILQPLEITAILLYIKAIKISPLSLTIPFLSLTPVFLIFTSFLMLKEVPSLSGAIGIILVAIGAYFLNLKEVKRGIFYPFKAILREKGSLFMIIVAFIYSITSNLGKIAIKHSDPIFFSLFFSFITPIELFPFVVLKSKNKVTSLLNHKISLSLAGFFFALMILFHNLALIQTNVAYMISVKRTNSLFSIIYGYIFFKEEEIKTKILGAVLMLSGVTLIGFNPF